MARSQSKKTRKKPSRRSGSASAGGAWLSRAAARSAVAASWEWGNRLALPAVMVALISSAALAYGPLRRHVGAVRADPVQVEIRWPALPSAPNRTWLPRAEQDRLRAIALAHVTADPFDVVSLREAREALLRTGWFVEPPTIWRKPAGRIEIEGAWRRPAAVVRFDSADRLVAADGALLPVRYAPGSAGSLPLVINPYAGPPTRADGAPGFGLVWPGGDVPAAIRLSRFLRDSPRFDAIAAVDVARYVSDGALTLVMNNGGRIVWGGAPGASAPGEATDEIKRTRFETIAGDPSLVAADKPPVEIHTRFVLIDESAHP